MRYLIIILAMLTACNISNEKDKGFENKIIGTWEIVKADSAVWIGEKDFNTKAKTDTLFIEKAGDYNLSVKNIFEETDGSAKLYMSDSTFVWDETYPLTDINLITEYTGDPYIISLGGGTRGFGDIGAFAEIGVNYNCGATPTGEEMFDFKIAVKDSVIRHYRFIVEGFVETVNEISC